MLKRIFDFPLFLLFGFLWSQSVISGSDIARNDGIQNISQNVAQISLYNTNPFVQQLDVGYTDVEDHAHCLFDCEPASFIKDMTQKQLEPTNEYIPPPVVRLRSHILMGNSIFYSSNWTVKTVIENDISHPPIPS